MSRRTSKRKKRRHETGREGGPTPPKPKCYGIRCQSVLKQHLHVPEQKHTSESQIMTSFSNIDDKPKMATKYPSKWPREPDLRLKNKSSSRTLSYAWHGPPVLRPSTLINHILVQWLAFTDEYPKLSNGPNTLKWRVYFTICRQRLRRRSI